MISIDNYDFKGKRAIIRVDFNVPLNEKGEVTDDTRIRAAIPTIKKVLDEGGSVILMSHMGRPKKNPDPKYSLEQIIPAIEKNLGVKVAFAGDCMGEKAAEMAKALKPGEVLLLENLRFYAEEEGKPRGLAEDATKEEKDAAKKALKEGPQKEFVKKLASYADCYINDAFGTAHRKHASTYLIAKHFPNDKMFGYLMEREVKAISAVMEKPAHPFCAIIGGSKVSSKIGVIKALIEKVDSIIIGGGMTYTFAAAQGGKVGNSICEPDMFPVALEILELAKQKGVELVMSPDALIADAFSADANTNVAPADNIPDGWEGCRYRRRGQEALPRAHPRLQDDPLERSGGRLRDRQVRNRLEGGGPGHRRGHEEGRLLAHRRRRLGGLHQQVRPGRPGILHLDRRRRPARVHRIRHAARRGGDPGIGRRPSNIEKSETGISAEIPVFKTRTKTDMKKNHPFRSIPGLYGKLSE